MSRMGELTARFPVLQKVGSVSRSIQLGAVAAAIALIVVASLWFRGPEYKVLFSNLQDRDGGAIITALTQMNVPYQLTENGTAILVPADKVHETRLQLAQQGLPRSGETGFELIDQTRFGASQFTEQVNFQRALEGELASSIQALNAVQHARVHLALPRETLFVRDRQPPSASVLLTLYAGRTLSEAQVSAITWLVSSSVPNLSADNVSVVDQNGRLLTAPAGSGTADATRRDLITEIETRTVQRILTLLNPIVGTGNVRAQVSADVDFSQREQTSEVYRPNQLPGQAAVRSQQTSASIQNGVQPPEGIPGALTNQPPADPIAPINQPQDPAAQQLGPDGQPIDTAALENAIPAPGVAAPAEGAQAPGTTVLLGGATQIGPQGSARNEATINYEVDRTISHVKDAVGQLRRLSVAVVVNYREVDGEPQPLPEAELEKIDALVKQAMGYMPDRGDTVSVINSLFSEDGPPEPHFWENPVYIEHAIQLLKYLLFVVAAILLWRGLGRPILDNMEEAKERLEQEAQEIEENRASLEAAERRASEMSRYQENLATARTMAQKDPRAVAMVLRSWMEKKNVG
ncbi:flagellar basal body M-ring protein FliF [bacterium SGD-2]|nr:flagellar basal body M-ring protein FliF [bacterium SGD-2]